MDCEQRELINKQYCSIDLFKFLCAILVIMIHVRPFGNTVSGSLMYYGNFVLQHYIARIAVPFFFVSAGFFLYRKTSYENFRFIYTKKYASRLIRLYFVWTIIYFPLTYLDFRSSGVGLSKAALMYIRDIVFSGSYIHLWFLPALIFAVFLVSILLFKKINPKIILVLSFSFYIIGLLAQSWFGLILPVRESSPVIWNILKLIQKIIVTTRDGLFEAFFFVSLGMYFSYYKIYIKTFKALALFLISFLLLGVEFFLLHYFRFIRAHDMFLFLAPVTFFLFAYLIGLRWRPNPVFKTLRMLSSLVFYSHLWIYWIVSNILCKVYSPLSYTCLVFVFTSIATIVFSIIVVIISRYKNFKWLQILYL